MSVFFSLKLLSLVEFTKLTCVSTLCICFGFKRHRRATTPSEPEGRRAIWLPAGTLMCLQVAAGELICEGLTGGVMSAAVGLPLT